MIYSEISLIIDSSLILRNFLFGNCFGYSFKITPFIVLALISGFRDPEPPNTYKAFCQEWSLYLLESRLIWNLNFNA